MPRSLSSMDRGGYADTSLTFQIVITNHYCTMSQPDDTQETDDEFHKCAAKDQKDSDFLEWCEETDNDPNDPGSREVFDDHQVEIEGETGDKFWDGLSPEDREGYEAMMTDD
jgi:hypothetical protein